MFPPRFSISKEVAVILGGVLMLFFVTPVADWWAGGWLGWTTPYALWLLVILGAVLVHWRDDSDGS